jgi:hypothetical protein
MSWPLAVRVSLATLALFVPIASAQQVSTTRPTRSSYERGAGPVVAIDDAHRNSERSDVRGLVTLLQEDGYRVRPFTEAMSAESLTGVDVLLIGNPGGWEGPGASLSTYEVSAVTKWVRAGGSLLLIIDHAPGPANAAGLTAALGVRNWHDGYAMVEGSEAIPVGNIIFWRSDSFPADAPSVGPTGPAGGVGYQGSDAVLAGHPITDGRALGERVGKVATFVGSAFQLTSDAEPLMTMPHQAVSLRPVATPGVVPVFTAETPRISVGGWLQGAVLRLGQGRVALFGETGLFSGGPAADNRLFVLNLFRWLSGQLRDSS